MFRRRRAANSAVSVTPNQQIKVLADFKADAYSPDKPFRIELSKVRSKRCELKQETLARRP